MESFQDLQRQHTRKTLEDKHYLVFSGGGIHGVSHLGVVSLVKHLLGGNEAFDRQFQGFAGTSVGAFLAMILACGEYNLPRLFYWMTNPSFFLKLLQKLDIGRAWKEYGAIPPDQGVRYLALILDTYFPEASSWTFQQLHDQTGKTLCVATVNVSRGGIVEYHSHITTPQNNVATSVFASMCVPMICQPVQINGMYYYDGGLGDNFPIFRCGFPPEQCLGSYLMSEPSSMHETLQSPPTVRTWSRLFLDILFMIWASNVYFPNLAVYRQNVIIIPQSKAVHFLQIWATTKELYELYRRGVYYASQHFQLDHLRELFQVR